MVLRARAQLPLSDFQTKTSRATLPPGVMGRSRPLASSKKLSGSMPIAALPVAMKFAKPQHLPAAAVAGGFGRSEDADHAGAKAVGWLAATVAVEPQPSAREGGGKPG